MKLVKNVLVSIAIIAYVIVGLPSVESTFHAYDGTWHLDTLQVTEPMTTLLMIVLSGTFAMMVGQDRIFAVHFGRNKAFALTAMLTAIMLPFFAGAWRSMNGGHWGDFWLVVRDQPNLATAFISGFAVAIIGYLANQDVARRIPLPKGPKSESASIPIASPAKGTSTAN